MSLLFRTAVLPGMATISLLAACNLSSPVEVRSSASTFPATASWSATASPVGTGTVSGRLAMKQFLGYRLEAAFQLTGAPNSTYQWRIFRGDCATTVAAVNVNAATGLLLFSTLQSYPDAVTSSAGSVTVNTPVAGVLDSLTAYSVRVRAAQSSTSWNGTSPIACGNLQRTAGS